MATATISPERHQAWVELGKQAAAKLASRLNATNATNANSFAADSLAHDAEQIVGISGKIDFAKVIKLQARVGLDLTSIFNSECIDIALADFVGGAMRFRQENPDE